eukprot:1195318-Prorocentrum_minimum.AAC.5
MFVIRTIIPHLGLLRGRVLGVGGGARARLRDPRLSSALRTRGFRSFLARAGARLPPLRILRLELGLELGLGLRHRQLGGEVELHAGHPAGG